MAGILFLGLAVLPLVSGNLIIYPHANGAPRSDKFQVFLTQNGNRHASFVYITSSSDRRASEASHVKPHRTMSWTSFAFTGAKVTVEVHAPRNFNQCIVRPKSYGIACHHAGNGIARFDVTSNTKMMSVEFDYDYGDNGHDITDKLMIFADPPETDVPNRNDNHVLYYDTGVHNLHGQVDVGAKTEVYLAPGAWVKGGFITSQNHPVKIYGRGIIDNRDYAWHDDRFTWATITMDKGAGHTVEGITLSDSMAFFVRMLSDRATIRNVKTVGAWINNNDGFSTGDDGTIEDSFIHANDDAIKLYSDNMHVRRCVVWQGLNGAVFQTGWWSGRDMQHVTVTDVDVIHTDWCSFKSDNCATSQNNAVFDQTGNTETFHVSDIEFRNIRVEGSCPRIIYWKMHSGAHGTVTNIRFINWDVDAQPEHDRNLHNEIAGWGTTGHVTNWHFINFKIGGQCITNANQADFRIDPQTTQGIDFQCGSGIVG